MDLLTERRESALDVLSRAALMLECSAAPSQQQQQQPGKTAVIAAAASLQTHCQRARRGTLTSLAHQLLYTPPSGSTQSHFAMSPSIRLSVCLSVCPYSSPKGKVVESSHSVGIFRASLSDLKVEGGNHRATG